VSAPRTHREVERKFRVHALFELPALTIGNSTTTTTGEPFEMEAVYHDTRELTLFRWGITLRRREGGPDAGWHMKLPVAGADGTSRDEMQLPLDAGPTGSVPGSLVEVVSPLLHELPLAPVVTLQTVRAPTVIRDDEGVALVEIVDDVVTVRHSGRVVSVFREVEVEALAGDHPLTDEVMASVSALLLARGAEPNSVSKAASALGPQTAQPPDVPEFPVPGPDGLAVDAIRAVLSRHVRHLLMADIGVRRDLPDSVHQMRVAARRLRSTLTTFAPLLDPVDVEDIREELRWMASELGAIRDTEVMESRLDEHAGRLADRADTDRCRTAIDALLDARLVSARASALAALRSDRHQDLVDDLMRLAVDPPVTDEAYASCAVALPPLVSRTWRRLAKAVNELDLDGPSVPWHEARIKAKRARYAAEAVEEIFGKRMRRLSQALAEITEVLGDHQDAYVAQTLLREFAGLPDIDGATGLSLGLLHAYETEVEIEDRLRFGTAWSHAVKCAREAGVA